MNIFTDTEQMQEASNELSAVFNDMRDVYHSLNNLIAYLEPTWKGAAATDYLNNLRKQLSEVKKLMDVIDALKRTADERIRTSISLDRLESLNIMNIAANVVDISFSLNASVFELMGL